MNAKLEERLAGVVCIVGPIDGCAANRDESTADFTALNRNESMQLIKRRAK